MSAELEQLKNINTELQNKNTALQSQLKEYTDSKKFTSNEWFRYWRTALKDQATVTSGVFSLFGAANMGYLVNNHIVKDNKGLTHIPFSYKEKWSMILITASILFYALLSVSRYFDYRYKTKYFRENFSFEEVRSKTLWMTKTSMVFLLSQIGFFSAGFGFHVAEIYSTFFK